MAIYGLANYKFLYPRMEAHIDHRDKRDRASDRKDEIERKDVAEKTVDQGGERSAADRCRADKAEDRASVLLGESEHHRGVEHGVARAIEKSREEGENAGQNKII